MQPNKDGTVTVRLTSVKAGYRGKNYNSKIAEMAQQGYEVADEREEKGFLLVNF